MTPLRERLREVALPVLSRHGAARALSRVDRLGEERAVAMRERGRDWRRRLEAIDAEDTRLAIALDAAVRSLPFLLPVVATERLVRRALARHEIGVADSDAFAQNLESLADEVVATWLPDVPLSRVRRSLRDAKARDAARRPGGASTPHDEDDARLGWRAFSEPELFARAAASLDDATEPSDAACLRALGAVPPVRIAMAASAAAGALRANLDRVEAVFHPNGTVGSVRTLQNRALLLAGLGALRDAVDHAFPGVRALLDGEPGSPQGGGPYRRAAFDDRAARSTGRLGATIDPTRLDDARDDALDAALVLELESRLVYGDMFARTPLAKCMAEDDLYEPGADRRRRVERAAARLDAAHEALLEVVRSARRHHAPCGIRDALVGALGWASAPPDGPALARCAEAAAGLRTWCRDRPEVPRSAALRVRALHRLARERRDAHALGGDVPSGGPIVALCRDVAVELADVLRAAPRDSELLLEELARPLTTTRRRP